MGRDASGFDENDCTGMKDESLECVPPLTEARRGMRRWGATSVKLIHKLKPKFLLFPQLFLLLIG